MRRPLIGCHVRTFTIRSKPGNGSGYARPVDWYPSKPTLAQVTLGIVIFIALAAVPLYWSLSEADAGNRIFLWVLGGMLLLLAIWRAGTAILLVRERRRRQM